jgi:hypothetical protein
VPSSTSELRVQSNYKGIKKVTPTFELLRFEQARNALLTGYALSDSRYARQLIELVTESLDH